MGGEGGGGGGGERGGGEKGEKTEKKGGKKRRKRRGSQIPEFLVYVEGCYSEGVHKVGKYLFTLAILDVL